MQKRVKNSGAHRVMITIIVYIIVSMISAITHASTESNISVENNIVLLESSPTPMSATKFTTEKSTGDNTGDTIDHRITKIKKTQKLRKTRMADWVREYITQRLSVPTYYLRYAGYCVGTLLSIITLRATLSNIKIFNKSQDNPSTQDIAEQSCLTGATKNRTGDFPIFVLAALNGDKQCVNNLLAQKVDVNTVATGDNVEIAGYTALHVASREGHTNIMQLLLDNKADANKEGKFGYTSLHIAAEYGQREAITLLLAGKADVNIRNQLDQTPGDLAQAHSDSGIIALLLNKQTRK